MNLVCRSTPIFDHFPSFSTIFHHFPGLLKFHDGLGSSGKFRIPSGSDNNGRVIGCSKKNSVSCIDKACQVAQEFAIFHLIQFFPQTQNFAMGSLAQISSGVTRCSFNTRFRARFPVQVPVSVQTPGEVKEGSGADTW